MRVNLKSEGGIDIVKRMVEKADVMVEPYRPGVMETVGLGPEDTLELNPKLIYARLTGWGQTGAFASMAGHDINYIALSGALSLFKRKGERPSPRRIYWAILRAAACFAPWVFFWRFLSAHVPQKAKWSIRPC